MAKIESLLSKNLRFLRNLSEPKLSQAELGKALGDITRSAISSYEDGRAEPKMDLLVKISSYFHVSIDNLLKTDLEQTNRNAESIAASEKKYVCGEGLRILTIPVDKEEQEHVVLVPQKAAAGYKLGFGDVEFIKDLPKYQLPFLPQGKTHRAFEITGDSMLPIQSGAVVIGEYIENWHTIKEGEYCIIITKEDGIVFKRVYKHTSSPGYLLLKSTNLAYASYEIKLTDIQELWKFSAYISTHLPDHTPDAQYTDLREAFWKLEDQVRVLMRKEGKKRNL